MEIKVGKIVGNAVKMWKLSVVMANRLVIPSNFVVPSVKKGAYSIWVELPTVNESELMLPVETSGPVNLQDASSFVIQREGDEFSLYMVCG